MVQLPSAIVDCPSCGVPFEGQWQTDVMDIEQLDGPPECVQTCPTCRVTFDAEYPGWTEFGGAG